MAVDLVKVANYCIKINTSGVVISIELNSIENIYALNRILIPNCSVSSSLAASSVNINIPPLSRIFSKSTSATS
eukprot:14494066-Ditylum_brightwellii.AAC.1